MDKEQLTKELLDIEETLNAVGHTAMMAEGKVKMFTKQLAIKQADLKEFSRQMAVLKKNKIVLLSEYDFLSKSVSMLKDEIVILKAEINTSKSNIQSFEPRLRSLEAKKAKLVRELNTWGKTIVFPSKTT